MLLAHELQAMFFIIFVFVIVLFRGLIMFFMFFLLYFFVLFSMICFIDIFSVLPKTQLHLS